MSHHPFCIFGRQPVLEALNAGKRFDKILLLKGAAGNEIKKIVDAAHKAETPVQPVPKEKLDKVAKKYAKHRDANHQGVVAFLSMIDYHTLDDVIHHIISKGRNPLLLILDGITDVGNFGAIARSAECFGADAMVIPMHGTAQINAEAIKASAGALNKILVCREKSLVMAIKYLKANGFKIYGTGTKGSIELSKADFSVPCAVIMGSEGDGITKELLRQCDEQIHIPMAGTIESLNVSVSAGVILYEAMKQRS